jgi:protein-tyrosine phosphatase
MRSTVYWITGAWPGRLALVPRPRGNDWLEDEAVAWNQAGLDVIVSLLEAEEAAELGLSEEAKVCSAAGIEFISFPFADRGVPDNRQAAAELADQLAHLLQQGKNAGLHCRQSIGRAPLIAACTLITLGLQPATALQQISEARGCPVPETPQQYEWLMAFALQRAG